jgi:hypothetical protein
MDANIKNNFLIFIDIFPEFLNFSVAFPYLQHENTNK